MEMPFPHRFRGLTVCLFGCLLGLIWFGSLNRVNAQLQLPSPSPAKDDTKKDDLFKEPLKFEKPKIDELLEGNGKKNGDNDKKADEEKKENGKSEAVKPTNLPSPYVYPARRLTIGECIRQAHERSPILKSLRIRVESAVLGQKGIENTSRIIHNLISPDLKYRKLQAENGITAAQVELMQAEHDVTFNVVRTYYSAVYAKEQLTLTSELVKTLGDYLTFVKEAVAEESVRGLDKKTEEIFVQYVAEAIDKRIQAEFGYRRAMEGLRHEIGATDDFLFTPAEDEIPTVEAVVDPDHAVALALHKRGEIALAKIGVNVLELEVIAQESVRFRLRMPTAAAASDVHSRSVPLGTRDGEYRPDAIAPDFPTLLVGDRIVRAERASSLLRGQETLLEKTSDLVKLETLNAVLRYEEAKRRVPEWKIAADAGKSSVARTRKDANGKPTDSTILTVEGLSAKSRGFYNEARYQQLIALAALERATAGGIRVDYKGR